MNVYVCMNQCIELRTGSIYLVEVDEQELLDEVVQQEIDRGDYVQQRNARREGHAYIQRAHYLCVLKGQPTIRAHVELVKVFLG